MSFALFMNSSMARLRAQRQVPIPIRYEELSIDNGYRLDLLVEDCVVVERKSIEQVLPVHRGQLLSYLRLGGFQLGYLLNFNVPLMRAGITRLVNGSDLFAAFAPTLRSLR